MSPATVVSEPQNSLIFIGWIVSMRESVPNEMLEPLSGRQFSLSSHFLSWYRAVTSGSLATMASLSSVGASRIMSTRQKLRVLVDTNSKILLSILTIFV